MPLLVWNHWRCHFISQCSLSIKIFSFIRWVCTNSRSEWWRWDDSLVIWCLIDFIGFGLHRTATSSWPLVIKWSQFIFHETFFHRCDGVFDSAKRVQDFLTYCIVLCHLQIVWFLKNGARVLVSLVDFRPWNSMFDICCRIWTRIRFVSQLIHHLFTLFLHDIGVAAVVA